ncbi:hypothetical protein [Streptomyces malaysiensis]|uniref:Uncharacterized protein n=1 Tax=Streptomyces malaysiensis subsp. samsunensis TaxID=459658 RepID=A0A9X2LXW9_STRMQ|nr:hypothetical protein [Streptomyces samsunensis]MCQ8831767.1 hypothetical protein [Streptomyces samsunensis]
MARSLNERLAHLIQGEQTDAVIRLEDRVTQRALGNLDDDFTTLVRRTLAAWTTAFGGTTGDATSDPALRRILASVRAAVRRLLAPLGPRAQRALDDTLTDAVLLGARQHAAFVRDATGRNPGTPPPRSRRPLRDAAAHVRDLVADRRDRALAMLRPAVSRRWSQVLTSIGTARGALSAVRSHITWVVGQAVNEGLMAGIRAAGAQKLWVAEQDACVRCAAYAGLVADVGDDFPGGLSWDPQQRGRGEPLPAPPLHPACRCRVVAWREEWAETGVPSFPEALRREARRSVARGFSLPTESNAARIRAARELLRRGANLPRSVEAYAATAIAAGRFTDRNVPTGRP